MGEAAAVSRTARADARRTAARRRAVGTRDRIVAHLALVAEVADGTGMASTRLAEAVGYPGSSVAFAQLLSGMERDGLISREVRGKRTYRIALSASAGRRRPGQSLPVSTASVSRPGQQGRQHRARQGRAGGGALPARSPFPAGVDYDELADRVIVRLLRRIAELNPAELAHARAAARPGRARPEELKIV